MFPWDPGQARGGGAEMRPCGFVLRSLPLSGADRRGRVSDQESRRGSWGLKWVWSWNGAANSITWLGGGDG